MGFWTEVAFCVAGTVVQGLLYTQHAALAQGMAALTAVHAVWAFVWFSKHTEACLWVSSRHSGVWAQTLDVLAIGFHVVVFSTTVVVLWTSFFWTATMVFALPILTTTHFLADVYWYVLQPWAPILWRPVQFLREMAAPYPQTSEPFAVYCLATLGMIGIWLLSTVVIPVIRVCFPAAAAVKALWKWLDDDWSA